MKSPALKRAARLVRSIGRGVRWGTGAAVDIWRADFAPLLLAVLAYSAAEQLGPRHATSDFYVVAAQIIPLLLLAIALEARLLSVGFPDIDALIADVEKAQEPLGEIEKEVDRLADEAPEQVAEGGKRSPISVSTPAGSLTACDNE
jgi:hypothetical protein